MKTLKNYSLIGEDAKWAVENGLAESIWYAAPISREQMRALLERRNGPAIIDTLLWFSLLGVSGYLIYYLWGTWWSIISIMIYSVLYASVSDSRWHESSHGTPFKSDWMNNALYEIASFMVFRQSVCWRWSHTRHHSDTSIVGRDPEVAAPRPPDIPGIILNLFAFKSFPAEFKKWILHVVGRMESEEKEYIPRSEYTKVFRIARIWLLIYLIVIGLAIYFQTWLPLFFVGIPTFIGSYMIVVYGLTQHAGLAENVLDHRMNCRTVYMNRVNRFLYWNMNYHLEHHMFPLVPYHNLPKLHQLVKSHCPTPYNGLVETYREIIPALIKQSKNPEYFVERKIPSGSETNENQQKTAFSADRNEIIDGNVKVCQVDHLAKGDVIRFDVEGSTYAVYRTEEGKYYATDGICTHGKTHLADGLIIGDQIECPKHNGRFSLVDGSVKRAPVCVGLCTYNVRVENDAILMNLDSRGGAGVSEEQPSVTYKVQSNHNVATYIKELVLKPLDANKKITYKPGDYIQLEVPVFQRSFSEFEIDTPYKTEWTQRRIFNYYANNLKNVRRNYSLATDPSSAEEVLKFNVRISLPPDGKNCSAGVGSSYVFGLKAGDEVKVHGPYGDFHITPSDREMVYIGGGAGMAPLRSHIAHLLESEKTNRKISYWYGARSKQELFYMDYFESLEGIMPNFSFRVALSEPLPSDEWTGEVGFIHNVIYEKYLSNHSKVENIDFYLCGPPAMIEASQKMLSQLGVEKSRIAFDEF